MYNKTIHYTQHTHTHSNSCCYVVVVLLFHIAASIYVVRRIRASIAEGEQQEKPILTPCSAIGKTNNQLMEINCKQEKSSKCL